MAQRAAQDVRAEHVATQQNSAAHPCLPARLPGPACSKENPIDRHTYLMSLKERNERLFYYVLSEVRAGAAARLYDTVTLGGQQPPTTCAFGFFSKKRGSIFFH